MTEFKRLTEIVRVLRAPGGCPWDREQTHESLKATCIEEAAEVVCGINILSQTGNPDNLKEELGDLLLQVVFQAQIAEEEGLFTLDDVIRGISEKMVRRHPHVFHGRDPEERITQLKKMQEGLLRGDEAAAALLGSESAQQPSAEEAFASWEEIKRLEKVGKEPQDIYLPRAFDESEQLIDRARKRKGYQRGMVTERAHLTEAPEDAGQKGEPA